MAIKFVDIEPEGEGKPKRSKKAEAWEATADDLTAKEPGVSPHPYAKPAPKKRGRSSGMANDRDAHIRAAQIAEAYLEQAS